MSTVAHNEESGDKVLNNMVRFRTDETLRDRIDYFCYRHKTTIQAICTEAVTQYLDDREPNTSENQTQEKRNAR